MSTDLDHTDASKIITDDAGNTNDPQVSPPPNPELTNSGSSAAAPLNNADELTEEMHQFSLDDSAGKIKESSPTHKEHRPPAPRPPNIILPFFSSSNFQQSVAQQDQNQRPADHQQEYQNASISSEYQDLDEKASTTHQHTQRNYSHYPNSESHDKVPPQPGLRKPRTSGQHYDFNPSGYASPTNHSSWRDEGNTSDLDQSATVKNYRDYSYSGRADKQYPQLRSGLNNAGMYSIPQPLPQMSDQDWNLLRENDLLKRKCFQYEVMLSSERKENIALKQRLYQLICLLQLPLDSKKHPVDSSSTRAPYLTNPAFTQHHRSHHETYSYQQHQHHRSGYYH